MSWKLFWQSMILIPWVAIWASLIYYMGRESGK